VFPIISCSILCHYQVKSKKIAGKGRRVKTLFALYEFVLYEIDRSLTERCAVRPAFLKECKYRAGNKDAKGALFFTQVMPTTFLWHTSGREVL